MAAGEVWVSLNVGNLTDVILHTKRICTVPQKHVAVASLLSRPPDTPSDGSGMWVVLMVIVEVRKRCVSKWQNRLTSFCDFRLLNCDDEES